MDFSDLSNSILPTNNQATMSSIDFNDETQVSQLCKLMKAINDNDMNSTFVGQPFYTDFDNDDPCVCIELGDVNGVRGYEKLLMLVNDDIELMYALYDAGGVRWSLTDNVRDTLDYTCDRDEEEED